MPYGFSWYVLVIDVAAGRRDDLLQVLRPLNIADLISLPVAPSLNHVAAVRPPFRLARLLHLALTGRRVAERVEHRPGEEARQRIVFRETVVGVVRRARGRRAVAAWTRIPGRLRRQIRTVPAVRTPDRADRKTPTAERADDLRLHVGHLALD